MHNRRQSGTGILEFSPAKAGQDITPADYTFEPRKNRKKSVSNLAGRSDGRSQRSLLTCVSTGALTGVANLAVSTATTAHQMKEMPGSARSHQSLLSPDRHSYLESRVEMLTR